MRNPSPLFIRFMSTNFYPNQVGPTKLKRSDSPRKTKKKYYITFIGVLLTQLTMESLPHDSMMKNYDSNTPPEG